jgi:TolA-binding protein
VKKAIPAALLLVLAVAPPALSLLYRYTLPDFAVYLKDADLPALYRTELRTLCLEEGDQYACFEYGLLYERDAVREHQPTLADSITWRDDRRRLSGDLLNAGLTYQFGEYTEALAMLDAIIREFPDKDIMVEAVLMKAQCQYHLGKVDEALMGLQSIRSYLPEGRAPDLDLYLGLCEEHNGNLEEAEKSVEQAETEGSADAVYHLMRLKLKQGDMKGFDVLAKEVAAGEGTECRMVCEIAGDVEPLLPKTWHALMDPVVADSAFTAGAHPEVVASIMRLAEAGDDVTADCEKILSRHVSPDGAARLRYARALAAADTAMCDTLAALSRTTSDPYLKARCIAAFLTYASGDRGALLLNQVLPSLGGISADLNPEERVELARRLAGLGQAELGRAHLTDLLEGLEVGRDDAALFDIASALEKAGATEQALSLYRALSESPVPSDYILDAERAVYLIESAAPQEEDMADVVERVAREGADPVELGDLFMRRLHDFKRAAGFYRQALDDMPDGVPVEAVKIKLAEALAASALRSGERGPRAEAMNLVAAVADTDIVSAAEVFRVLKVSTSWLREERTRAFEIIQGMSRREDLSSSDLYQMARVLYNLFSQRDGNVYAQCALSLRRLGKEYPTSKEAPSGACLAARLKFLAGDYVGALESYQACREVWRKHAVTPLCDEGIGDCYLYSGGVEEAISRYRGLATSPEVAFKAAQCYEILDRPDSALYYCSLRSAKVYSPAIFVALSLRRALLIYSRDGLDAALRTLDSPFPMIREQLKTVRDVVAAYALARAGYTDLGTGVLTRVSDQGGDTGCDALLLLSELDDTAGSGRTRASSGDGETLCKSIFGALRLLYERAYVACSAGHLDSCLKERKRYLQRFPLDERSKFKFGVSEALLLYRDGENENATSMIDSLAATGRKDDALAYGFYREGIHYMVDGDYTRAAGIFRRIEADYPGLDTYYDTVFKLGTAYYMLEKYDSSATSFDMATRAGSASLVEDAYFNLGLALEETGSLDEASDAYRNLAVRFPLSERFERALMRAAYTKEQAGKPAEAIALYKALLRYAEDPESAAEALYWTGEAFAEMGEPLRAACEFMRVVHLFPGGGPWTGTAAFRAGVECEEAGLKDHAMRIYRDNVKKFGTGSDWGQASKERLDELERPGAGQPGTQESAPAGKGARSGPGHAPEVEGMSQ